MFECDYLQLYSKFWQYCKEYEQYSKLITMLERWNKGKGSDSQSNLIVVLIHSAWLKDRLRQLKFNYAILLWQAYKRIFQLNPSLICLNFSIVQGLRYDANVEFVRMTMASNSANVIQFILQKYWQSENCAGAFTGGGVSWDVVRDVAQLQ